MVCRQRRCTDLSHRAIDDTFDATANVLTASGYVVVKPSVDFDIGYPGEAWVKGVTSAAKKAPARAGSFWTCRG